MAGRRAERERQVKVEQASDALEVVLGEMKKAVPEIERRVRERETLAAESRFETPKPAEAYGGKGES